MFQKPGSRDIIGLNIEQGSESLGFDTAVIDTGYLCDKDHIWNSLEYDFNHAI